MKVCIALSLALASASALPAFFSNPFTLSSETNRLIKLGPDEYRLVSEADKLKLRRSNVNFIDVTRHVPVEKVVQDGVIGAPEQSFFTTLKTLGSKQLHHLAKEPPVYNYPKKAHYKDEVNRLIAAIDVDSITANLNKFTSFYTRYYKSESGFESANWLYDYISSLVAPVKEKVSVTKFHHDGWDQFSIIVSIPGEVADKVVVGAHQDSINLLFPNLLKAPGADDDGSGTVTILEVLRLLLGEYEAKTFKPYNTLEFHFFSAEEGGLLGSIDVFSNYSSYDEVVVGMLQQDMTGYSAGSVDAGVEPHIGLITDYTSVALNDFLKVLVDTYNDIPYHESSCGYACSDHASAIENGYPASFLIESEMKYTSKYIHSVLDTVDRIDWDHVTEHVKLTIAYAYELSLAKKLHWGIKVNRYKGQITTMYQK